MGFWSLEHLDLADPLNEDIWVRSPAMQRAVQSPTTLRHPGALGAQQAMLHPGADVPAHVTIATQNANYTATAPPKRQAIHSETLSPPPRVLYRPAPVRHAKAARP